MMRNLLVFISYFLLGMLFFFKGYQGMLVTDVTGWFHSYEVMGWNGLLYSFGDKSLHYLYHLVFFLCFKLFGFNNAWWAAFYILAHAVAATTAFIFFKKIYRVLGLPFAVIVSYLGSLLFLLSAYNAEPVLWAACIHYPLCTIFTLLALNNMVEYALYGKALNAWLFVLFYIMGLFCLELALALPFICIPLLLVFRHVNFSRQKFLSLQAISVLIVLAYLVLNKIRFGTAVGHYGAATHLNTDPELLLANLNKYLTKYFVFSQFWPFETMNKIYVLFETSDFAYGSLVFFAVIIIAFIFYRDGLSKRVQTGLLMLGCAVMALAPVLNLFFTSIVHNECDRLGYFFGVFFSQALVVMAFSFLPYGAGIVLVYLGINVFFLNKNVTSWKNAGQVEENLLKTYKWQKSPKVFILNLPDNLDGAYMYRSDDTSSGIKDALLIRGIVCDTVEELLKYNMLSVTDSVTIKKLAPNELQVTLAQWGNWWWKNGKGATSYSNKRYDIRVDEWGHSFTVKFKSQSSPAVYLYQCGKQWREFNF
ncbi:MAG: hypothetical protein JWO06_53 [Bacteroidota bacterium]|nr:hypothetical protein [Bacteroidota bacterium]